MTYVWLSLFANEAVLVESGDIHFEFVCISSGCWRRRFWLGSALECFVFKDLSVIMMIIISTPSHLNG